MSIPRRLQRLVRAYLGSLGWESDDDRSPRNREAKTGTTSSTGTSRPNDTDPDVPPDIVKAYRALEVPVGSSRETVKRGYRQMMKKYHQDRFEKDEEKRAVAGEVSKRLNLAYERVTRYLDDEAE